MMISFLAVLIFSVVNGAWILRRMQNSHLSVWRELGQPTVTMSSGIAPRIALVRYIWSLRFLKLEDPLLSITCWMAIAAEVLLVVIFLLLIVRMV